MKKIELIIFDCDGVLVDSEIITNRVFAAMITELGVPVNLDYMFENFVGNSMAQCFVQIEQMIGRPLPESFLAQYHTRSKIALEQELKMVVGIDKVLSTLKIPYCVASNGSHEKMQTTLGITGLLPNFMGKQFSASDVAQGKPAPDLYLQAARAFGVIPSACAVIEDTPTGVRAGIAAGMQVYGYTAFTPEHRLIEAGAHGTFKSMDFFPEYLLE